MSQKRRSLIDWYTGEEKISGAKKYFKLSTGERKANKTNPYQNNL
jgi:hypothetical protein